MSWDQLRQQIERSLSLEEVRTLCFALGEDYDSLSGEGKSAKIRELIAHFKRTGKVSALIDYLKSVRPNVPWDRVRLDDSPAQIPTQPASQASPSWSTHSPLPTPQSNRTQASSSWKKWGDHPIMVLVGLVVAALAISTFIRGNQFLDGQGASANTTPAPNTVVPPSLPASDTTPVTFISAGPFLMGNNDGDDDQKPEHDVYLNDYWIDTYEVINADYQEFVQQTNHRLPDHWQNGDIPSGQENHPVVGVTWYDAVQYCEWRGGKRLPTEAEWEKAARGTDGRDWPWGPVWRDAYANTFEAETNHTEPVGTFVKDKSPYGVMDMAGNVNEWVNDKYEEDYYSRSISENPQGPRSGVNRVVRGGAYWLPKEQAATYARVGIFPPDFPPPAIDPTTPTSTIGFRCACTSCRQGRSQSGTASGTVRASPRVKRIARRRRRWQSSSVRSAAAET